MMTALITLAVVIIGLLSAYAGYLLMQLKKQKQQQAKAAEQFQLKQQQRIDYIQMSIQVIAKGVSEDQCEIGEGAIRIAGLFRAAETAGIENRYKALLPKIHELNSKIQHHPILEARKQYQKKELMKFDFDRMKLEVEYKDAINQEVKQLHDFDFSKGLTAGDIPIKLMH